MKAQCGFRGGHDGFPEGLDGYPEPTRLKEDVPKDNAARLKALGNAVVPQIVYEIAKSIMAVEGKLK